MTAVRDDEVGGCRPFEMTDGLFMAVRDDIFQVSAVQDVKNKRGYAGRRFFYGSLSG
jgi:hypothetical protein